MARAGAILLAAGAGRRFGRGTPKQMRFLGGRPLFFWPLKTFDRVPAIHEIVLVVPSSAVDVFRRWTRHWRVRKLKDIIPGGQTRNESVCRGVQALSPDLDVALVHDAARPLVTGELTRQVLNAAYRHGASLAAVPVQDTLKKESPEGFVKGTVDREGLWAAQTPQAFRMSLAVQWFTRPAVSVTDDVQVFEKSGVHVKLVPGSSMNLKVTYPEDFELCQAYRRVLSRS
jgi:2-C-methyl-D-erythritol 4-phosphate cytidylyltransferase